MCFVLKYILLFLDVVLCVLAQTMVIIIVHTHILILLYLDKIKEQTER